MGLFESVLLSCLFVYVSLLLVIIRDRHARLRIKFCIYLVIALIWSLTTFLLLNDWMGATNLWAGIVFSSGACAMISYYDFVSVYTTDKSSLASKLGYLSILFVFVPLVTLGYIPESVSVSNGSIEVEYGLFLYLATGIGVPFFILSVYRLVTRLRAANDHQNRNRIVYMLGGLGLLLIFGLRTSVPPLPTYPVEQIGHLCNALLITYAITKYKLLDVKLVLRKGLIYSSIITIFITFVSLLLLLMLQYTVQIENKSSEFIVIGIMALVMAILFKPMRALIETAVDRIFYRETYEYRQLVLSFAQRMSNVLDLGELAEAMLKPIVKAVGASEANLLLPGNGYFNRTFTERLVDKGEIEPVSLKNSSPIVTWLAQKNEPLAWGAIEASPDFQQLGQADRNTIERIGLELLVPIRNRGELIAILAMGKKESGGSYAADDIELVTTLTTEAAIVIANAQLYAQARERSRIDELTGLSNHRSFHERLDEEIGRCCRFGDIFSLIFIDVDSFKTYNDVYGHLRGDRLLREIGQIITGSIRGIDTAFRYGGDEFAVIVPSASLNDAFAVAERIRKRIEGETETEAKALTCSIGIASWPTDGAMREQLLQAADAALYFSKQSGRNRTAMASDVTISHSLGAGIQPEGKLNVLSTIYALAATVDAKDSHTYGHSKKVSTYATEIAAALDLPEDRRAAIRAAALLHDIGKIGVSDEILAKTSTLDYHDRDAIRAHPKLGVAILKHVDQLSACLAGILYHHEHYDGTGYPSGLKGENIPLDARILSVSDAYDAMTSFRPYRERRMPPEEALDELKRCSGTQFDPRIVDVFLSLKRRQKSGGVKSKRSTVAASQ